MAKKKYEILDKNLLKEYCDKCIYRYYLANDLCCKDCCHNPIEEYRGEISKQELNTPKSKDK